jgi:hypothetical protein
MGLRLVQCIASQSGLFRNKKIDFAHQVTVFYGPNDSGKTFLAHAIIDLAVTTFYPDTGSSPINWEKTHIDVSFEHNGQMITCSRTGNQSASISIDEEGTPQSFSFTPSSPETPSIQPALSSSGSYLSLLHRFGTDGFMESCIAASPLDEGNTINYGVLRRIFIQDSSKLHRLLGIIKKVFPEKGLGTAGLMAQIVEHENEIRQIEKQIQLSHIQKERRSKLENETEQTRKAIEDQAGRLKDLLSSLEDANTAIEIQKQIKEIKKTADETEQLRSLELEKIRVAAVVRGTLEKVFPQFIKFSELQKDNLSFIQTAYRKIRDDHENLTTMYERKKRIKSKAIGRSALISVIISAAAAAPLITPRIRHIRSAPVLIIVTAAAVLLILLLTVYISFRVSAAKVPEKEALQTLAASESRMAEILTQNGIAINGLNADDIYEFLLQYFEEYGFFAQQESDVMTIERDLKTPEFFSTAEILLQGLGKKKAELTDLMAEILTRLNISSTENGTDAAIAALIAVIETTSAEIADDIEKKKELLSRIEDDLKIESADSDSNRNLEEQLAFHRGKLVVLCRKNRLARYIISLMDESVLKREEILFLRLAEHTAEIFHNLTSKQYATTINTQEILSFIKGDSSVAFNAQIAHIIVLSAKLALSDYFHEEKIELPLFIDEPAVFMDSGRIKSFIEIVRTCSRKRQIIILTHDRNLCEGADIIVEL